MLDVKNRVATILEEKAEKKQPFSLMTGRGHSGEEIYKLPRSSGRPMAGKMSSL